MHDHTLYFIPQKHFVLFIDMNKIFKWCIDTEFIIRLLLGSSGCKGAHIDAPILLCQSATYHKAIELKIILLTY